MPARPPSEQGIEYDLADKIDALLERLNLPVPQGASPNWWDVLGAGGEQLANSGYQTYTVLYGKETYPLGQLKTVQYPDRIVLTITVGNSPIWQRALFFHNPKGITK